MPPKVKITKEDIVSAAVGVVREQGAEVLGARQVAAALGCSTQPLFSNFASMEELRSAVVAYAYNLCGQYIRQEIERGEYPVYKCSGIAYIRFAKEERELFKLLYMRDRSDERIPESDLLNDQMERLVQKNTGLSGDEVKLFQLEMWTCVHGIASMLATRFVDLEWELVSRMLTDVYQGLRKQYGME